MHESVCIYVHITDKQMHIYIYIYIYIHTYLYVYRHTCVSVYVHMYVCLYTLQTFLSMCAYIHNTAFFRLYSNLAINNAIYKCN